MTEDQPQPESNFRNLPPESQKSRLGLYLKLITGLLLFCLGAVVFSGLVVYTLNQPGNQFPVNKPVTIEPGTSVAAIAAQLKAQRVVQSEQLLYYVLVFMHNPADLKASTYVFDEPINTLAVAKRLTEGDFDTDLVRFTHIEGERATLLASRAAKVFPSFNQQAFVEKAAIYEGRLFPETYFVPPSFTDQDLLTLMLETYQEKTKPLQPEILASPLTEDEIIILASILEREANSPESMSIVSGILQNRLAIDMPLQADATIEYVIETPLGELPPGQLASELRELDSPYNSYLNIGLPPTPIGNPGLDAITAVLNPAETKYFYYVTGNDGEFYYAETYDQHLQNIAQYLR